MGFQVSPQLKYYGYVDVIDTVKDIINDIDNSIILTDFEKGVWVMEVQLMFLYKTQSVRNECKFSSELNEKTCKMNEFVDECKLNIGSKISELFKTYGTVRDYLIHKNRIEILEQYKNILN